MASPWSASALGSLEGPAHSPPTGPLCSARPENKVPGPHHAAPETRLDGHGPQAQRDQPGGTALKAEPTPPSAPANRLRASRAPPGNATRDAQPSWPFLPEPILPLCPLLPSPAPTAPSALSAPSGPPTPSAPLPPLSPLPRHPFCPLLPRLPHPLPPPALCPCCSSLLIPPRAPALPHIFHLPTFHAVSHPSLVLGPKPLS